MACYNCRTMIDILKKEVEELSTRQQQLIRVNNALTEVVKKTENTDHLQEQSWKNKYEELLRTNQNLKKRIIQLQSNQDSHLLSSFIELETPKKNTNQSRSSKHKYQKSSSNNQNHRSNSVSRMQEFMKTAYIPKIGQFTSSTHRSTYGNKKGKGEIVLRIVNDKLNRRY